VHRNGFLLPSHPRGKISRVMDRTGQGVPPAAATVAWGYLSYEYELVPPIRTAGPRCGDYDAYAIRNLSM
jgi:hypothetical protein